MKAIESREPPCEARPSSAVDKSYNKENSRSRLDRKLIGKINSISCERWVKFVASACIVLLNIGGIECLQARQEGSYIKLSTFRFIKLHILHILNITFDYDEVELFIRLPPSSAPDHSSLHLKHI